MIHRLSIQNYESHADTQVQFHPGVNVIVGLSDAGKSALFRAMCWCMFNRPSGDVFMRRGTKEAQVTIEVDGGVAVTRQRGKSKNEYHLDTADNDQTFTAFGSDVPEDIQAALNMDRGLNVAGQIDPIFLLQESPGEVARHFNDTAGLSDIDRSMSHLQGRERKVKRRAESLKEREQELAARLEQYGDLASLQQWLEAAEALSQDIAKAEGRCRALTGAISVARRGRQRVEALSQVTEQEPALNEALELSRGMEAGQAELKRWRYAVRAYREAERRVESLSAQVQAAPMVGEGEHNAEAMREAKQRLTAWRQVRDRFWQADENVQAAEVRLKELEAQWHALAPDVCPLCEGSGRLHAPEAENPGQGNTGRQRRRSGKGAA